MMAKGSLSWILGVFLFSVAAGIGFQKVSGSLLISIIFLLLFAFSVLLTLFFIVFFRDPERYPQGDEDDAVSPADGKVIYLQQRAASIFMNIHNVHVNRAPLSGVVEHIDYKPGGYIPAFNKDSRVNERNHVIINTISGTLELTQIAGVLTRRIVSYINQGTTVKRGERIGMIRFGSRVDVTIPEDYIFTVTLNQNVKAGETIIARKREKIGN